MGKLESFIAAIRSHPKFRTDAAANPSKLEALGDLENLFVHLQRYEDPRVIDLHDQVARIVANENRTLKKRLIEVHATVNAALPWIRGLLHESPGPKQ